MPRQRLSQVLFLILGTVLGGTIVRWVPPTDLRADSGNDRSGESILATGPVALQVHPTLKVPIGQDALYFLDYKGGRLLAAVPSPRQVGNAGRSLIDDFSERDLITDFHLGPGVSPRFLMTVGQVGAVGEGWAPLYVLESTTGQLGIYRVQPQAVGISTQPRFDLLELKTIPGMSDATP